MLLWIILCSMLHISWSLSPVVISRINNGLTIEDFQPQQIHLSIGDTSDTVVVTWITPSETPSSVVKYGIERMDNGVQGTLHKFMDGGKQHRLMWIHRVALKNLSPNTKYIYHCGSPLGWSEEFSFTTWKNGTDWPARVVMFGDMGAVNPQSLPRLQEETQLGMYDAVIHVGDFAYDMDTNDARVGDEFMRQIQPIAAYVPYMTCVGNHEFMYNFSNYRARFTMPNYEDTENLFFSWNMGPVHFIAVSTEVYYFVEFGLKPLSRQFEWLINDLEEATKPEARAERPWIVLYGHRPMYCSNTDHDDCSSVNCLTRVGISLLNVYGMEALLDKYGVDVAVWAHEHSYERMWPTYNYTVYNGSMEEPYTNPRMGNGSVLRFATSGFDVVCPDGTSAKSNMYIAEDGCNGTTDNYHVQGTTTITRKRTLFTNLTWTTSVPVKSLPFNKKVSAKIAELVRPTIVSSTYEHDTLAYSMMTAVTGVLALLLVAILIYFRYRFGVIQQELQTSVGQRPFVTPSGIPTFRFRAI